MVEQHTKDMMHDLIRNYAGIYTDSTKSLSNSSAHFAKIMSLALENTRQRHSLLLL